MKIQFSRKLIVPDTLTIPYIEGDGIGPDIMKASLPVWDEAIKLSYGDERKIEWLELFAGEKSLKLYGEMLPEETLEKLKDHIVGIKGPLTTPVGGYKSLNVTIREYLDLVVNFRPIKYFKNVPSVVKNPQKLNIFLFRENTEDLYRGIEWEPFSENQKKFALVMKENFGIDIDDDTGISLKFMSEKKTKRFARISIEYALKNGRKKITVMHKGNIMKFTEGYFLKWIMDVINEMKSVNIFVKDMIADNVFQQSLMKPENFDVILAGNLNGDYISDALAGQIGGSALVPSVNMNETYAIFETSHGSAPKYAGKNVANPVSLILSGSMLLKHIGWNEAGELIEKGLIRTFEKNIFTQDLARYSNTPSYSTMDFSREVIKNMRIEKNKY